MASRKLGILWLLVGLVCIAALPVSAQSFRVQCPTSTITHPVWQSGATTYDHNVEPPYTGPTTQAVGTNGYMVPTAPTSGAMNVNGAIKCQQVSGGDGYSTMANGVQTFMFSFGPLSGLADIAKGLPATQFPDVFNTTYPGTLMPGDPATTDGAVANTWPVPNPVTANVPFSYNG